MPEAAELATTYDPHQVEDAMYALWEEAQAFRAVPDDRPPDRRFVVMIPLPNVTGALHLGHAINNTLQDIQVRYHRMMGDNTLWQPGTDHAGIATQAVVERRIFETEGKNRHDLGREELVRRIWEWKDQYQTRILGQLKQMGCSCDWERTRFTLDDVCAKAVRHMFFKMFKDGLIYRGKRLVNWDTQLQTAVADDEVYHETVKGHFWHFKYPVIPNEPQTSVCADADEGGTSNRAEPEFVIIATTRPETMLADTAVAVNPDPEGTLNRAEEKLRAELPKAGGKERAEINARLKRISERRETHLPLLITLRDMANAGRKVMLPLVDRPIPLITDEHADPELGTGCVKITPAHDQNDYEVGQRHGLPMVNVLTPEGKVAEIIEPDGSKNPNSDRYAGLVFNSTGRQKVADDLEALGLVDHVDDRDIDLGHSDRSKSPIEPYLSDQWFVRMGDISEPQTSVCADPDEPQTSVRADPDEPQTSVCADPSEPRTSVRADVLKEERPPRRPTPDLSAGAVLLTWTTYGTWLPGDERGFVSRVPDTTGGHILHNAPGEPYDADDQQIRNQAIERMEGDPLRMNADQSRILLASIAESAERHAIELLAVAVMPDHVHVLCQTDRPGGELHKLLKGAASRRLNQRFSLPNAPRWFTRRGSTRFIKPGSDLTAAIVYIQQQERSLAVWSFDDDSGMAAEVVEQARASQQGTSARTEVRGSFGVKLADGTVAPGLAQAAIDAVKDGRVKVFPDRYTKTYLDWLGEKRDWCISRQLWWGHRIPVWTIPNERARGLPAHPQFDKLTRGLKEFRDSGRAAHHLWPDPAIRFRAEMAEWVELTTGTWCPHPEHADNFRDLVEPFGFEQDPDVLDTWFSSQLWPFSTLGWPDADAFEKERQDRAATVRERSSTGGGCGSDRGENGLSPLPYGRGSDRTTSLDYYYPGSVLITSRDIITLWVARMVLSGLYCVGDIPFDHVYIHTKLLDGRGETMSKSKGNGVDPVDIIKLYGADALRYSIADLATETQDVRMPVDYLCPHCQHLTPQKAVVPKNKRPSDVSKVKCKSCKKEFATQWADDALKAELHVARETSDRFELGRNFSNKLWNAARFAFMNIEGAPCDPIALGDLPAEDRWILAELSAVVRCTNEQLKTYQFAQCIKDLREFFWDSLCDWYIELTKARMTAGGSDGGVATQVLTFVLDQVLRLLHPFMPFITERLWQQLNAIAPRRGLPGVAEPEMGDLLIKAQFPPAAGWPKLDDAEIREVFEDLQTATRGVRDLRSKCGLPPRQQVTVTLIAPAEHVEALRQDASIIQRLANVAELTVTTGATRPKNAATLISGHVQIFVHGISDDAAEAERLGKEIAETKKQIAASQARLSNESFTANAPAEVVEAARTRLGELDGKLQTLQANLSALTGT